MSFIIIKLQVFNVLFKYEEVIGRIQFSVIKFNLNQTVKAALHSGGQKTSLV